MQVEAVDVVVGDVHRRKDDGNQRQHGQQVFLLHLVLKRKRVRSAMSVLPTASAGRRRFWGSSLRRATGEPHFFLPNVARLMHKCEREPMRPARICEPPPSATVLQFHLTPSYCRHCLTNG